ncbi:hypothetical protein TWF481_004883 [Arthrobotrys musiformis]|uniref:F-box domain-containing protein n=1 Tax=Arthrobotrys musiformis TaxID=47236 RepID=A0AAV9WKV9_9PEZI
MASLLSLPQELVNMIFSDLPPRYRAPLIGKMRLVSKDYNDRFQDLFWYTLCQNFRINLTTAAFNRLLELIEDSKSNGMQLATRIRGITIWSRFNNRLGESYDQLLPVLIKVFSSLHNLRSIEFTHEVSVNSSAFDYWKPVMDALIESKTTTIESIKTPWQEYCNNLVIPASKFKLSPKQLARYQATFCNLSSLHISTAIQRECPDSMRPFWTFVAALGGGLDNLTVTVSNSTNYASMAEAASGDFMPQGLFTLPRLKRLQLIGAPVTIRGLKGLLKIDSVEVLSLTDCRLKNPEGDWFEVLQFLRDVKLLYDPLFREDSPNLWVSGGKHCVQKLKNKKVPVTLRNLRNEIKASKPMGVQGGMANGWTRKRLTIFQRLQLAWRWYKYEAEKLPTAGFGDAEAQEVKDQYDEIVSQIRAAGEGRSIRG